jgi:hypothetical protein
MPIYEPRPSFASSNDRSRDPRAAWIQAIFLSSSSSSQEIPGAEEGEENRPQPWSSIAVRSWENEDKEMDGQEAARAAPTAVEAGAPQTR